MSFVRRCSVCVARGESRLAESVARGADGAEWFVCAVHSDAPNLVGSRPIELTPIAQWFTDRGLPPPSQQLPERWQNGGRG